MLTRILNNVTKQRDVHESISRLRSSAFGKIRREYFVLHERRQEKKKLGIDCMGLIAYIENIFASRLFYTKIILDKSGSSRYC
jgi:hypothetical protein